MEIHLLIALGVGVVLDETAPTSLDLNAASRLLLDMLDVAATRTDNLSAQIESRNGLQINWNALVWPLAAATLVTLVLRLLRGLTATEAALIDEVRQLRVHELVDLLDGFLETFLGCAGDMKIERRVLASYQRQFISSREAVLTAGVAMLLSG